MYRYSITLFPEKVKERESVDLTSSEDLIIDTATSFNESSKLATNVKSIETESIKVFPDHIELILQSDNWMEYPTKGLRGFIIRLSKEEPFCSLISSNGRLFRGNSSYIDELHEQPANTDTEMTDEELIVALFHLFQRRSTANEQTIRNIKELVQRSEN